MNHMAQCGVGISQSGAKKANATADRSGQFELEEGCGAGDATIPLSVLNQFRASLEPAPDLSSGQ